MNKVWNVTPCYWPADSAAFRKNKDAFGGLSNMAGGYPMTVYAEDGSSLTAKSSEALYQALRFEDEVIVEIWEHGEKRKVGVQSLILSHPSPMGCKMAMKPHIRFTRPEWGDNPNHPGLRQRVMWWSLLVKMAYHTDRLFSILNEAEGRHIVEYSTKDPYWGADLAPDGRYYGRNVLGQMWADIRILREQGYDFSVVPDPDFDAFIYGKRLVGFTYKPDTKMKVEVPSTPQLSLF